MRGAQRVLGDPAVVEAIKTLNLGSNVTVLCDPWMYGAGKR